MLGIVGEAQAFLREAIEKPRAWLIDARAKARDLPKTNFDLGREFAARGQWYDAAFRFKIVLYLNPAYPQARFNLGCCYFNLGQKEKARLALQKVLSEQPSHSDAILMLCAIDPASVPASQQPKRIPADLVTGFYATQAAGYNATEAAQQYRGGKLVFEQIKPLLPAHPIALVDLGCGTGIAAIPYHTQAQHMVGVDISPAMAAQARTEAHGDKKLFDQVVEADIAAPVNGIASGVADVVLMVNVSPFLGELNAPLVLAARLLKSQGLLAVTVEPYKGTAGYGIVPQTGRFGHQASYVKQLAASLGLEPIKQQALALYPASTAELIVLRKAG